MNAGELDKKIQLWDFATSSDGAGGTTAIYRLILSPWAKIIPLSGSRGIEGSAIELEQVYELWIRYEDYPPLNKKIKIKFENRNFTIHAFQNYRERNEWFKIIVKEDSGRDNIIYDENYQPIVDKNGNFITT